MRSATLLNEVRYAVEDLADLWDAHGQPFVGGVWEIIHQQTLQRAGLVLQTSARAHKRELNAFELGREVGQLEGPRLEPTRHPRLELVESLS